MHFLQENNRIYVYKTPVLDSRMYVIINDQDDSEALIIDPLVSDEAIPVLKSLRQASVLFTHSHYDHISGMTWLRRQVSCILLCSECCAQKINDPHANFSALLPALIIGKTEEEREFCMTFFEQDYACQADQTFEKEILFSFGSYEVEITHTPGHSECSQCVRLTSTAARLYSPIVFTGDSFVNGHEVITRLPGGNKKAYQAIAKPYLDALPADTLLMPGHGDFGFKKDLYDAVRK